MVITSQCFCTLSTFSCQTVSALQQVVPPFDRVVFSRMQCCCSGMLVCTELRLDISCNLLLGYTVHCVIVHASLLPANSYFVKECQVNRITQSLCPDVGTLAPHLAKAVHKAWEMIKTASALLQTNRLQSSNAGLVKAPPHRSTQAAHPQQLTSKC